MKTLTPAQSEARFENYNLRLITNFPPALPRAGNLKSAGWRYVVRDNAGVEITVSDPDEKRAEILSTKGMLA